MLTLAEIREDLKAVRYYYSRQNALDKAFAKVGSNAVLEIASKYNRAVKSAPPRLYDLYTSLYVRNYTQEGLSIELNYTPEYIQMLNKKLLLFLQSQIGEEFV